MSVCLFVYLLCLLDRTKRIDIDRPKRSSELDHHQIISNTSNTSTSISGGSSGGRISSRSSSIKEEEEELPWLVERKKNYVLFWKK